MRWGRTYFAVQAVAGALWWAAVFASPVVRDVTLGGLDPVAIAVFDIPLFVMASFVAAFGVRGAAVVSTGWTGVVAIALAVYATVTTEAGWGAVTMAAATLGCVVALCLVMLGRVPTAWIIRGPFAFRPAAIRATAATNVASTFRQIVVFWGLFLVVIPLIVAAVVIGYAIAGSLLWNYVIRPLEESDLEQRFGEVFRQYRETVRCWIPRAPASFPLIHR